jgi:hypothetical protein
MWCRAAEVGAEMTVNGSGRSRDRDRCGQCIHASACPPVLGGSAGFTH